MYHPRNNNLLDKGRTLRKNMTEAECKLWYQFLRKYSPRFRRQEIVGDYIADFYCAKAKLVVELDGGQHYEKQQIEYDIARTEYIEALGIEVLRFSNHDVFINFTGVCDAIDICVQRKIK